MKTIQEMLTQFAQDHIKDGQRDLENFKKRFVDNPANAFEWSALAFRAAARVHVGRIIETWLSDKFTKFTPEIIMREVEATVVHCARFPERSTSVQANTMHQEINSVWAELLARHKGW